MADLQEDIEKRIEKGFDAIRGGICLKVGSSKMLVPGVSVFHNDLSIRAKRLLGAVEEVEAELKAFMLLRCEEPKGDQLGLVLDSLDGLAKCGVTSISITPGHDPTEPAKRRSSKKSQSEEVPA